MWFAHLLTPTHHRRRKPARRRLAVLPLEDRCLPSGFNVINLGGGTAYDLNNVGQVVGNMGVLNWQTGTTSGPTGMGINDAGQVAGGDYLETPSSAGWSNTRLGYLSGDTAAGANDLNMAGQVVAVSQSGASGG